MQIEGITKPGCPLTLYSGSWLVRSQQCQGRGRTYFLPDSDSHIQDQGQDKHKTQTQKEEKEKEEAETRTCSTVGPRSGYHAAEWLHPPPVALLIWKDYCRECGRSVAVIE